MVVRDERVDKLKVMGLIVEEVIAREEPKRHINEF